MNCFLFVRENREISFSFIKKGGTKNQKNERKIDTSKLSSFVSSLLEFKETLIFDTQGKVGLIQTM